MLQSFQLPDPVLEWEWRYLSFRAAMAVAEKALKEGRHLYARQLLEEAERYENGIPGRKRQRLLQLGAVPGVELTVLVKQLPSLDEELLLRAEGAFRQRNWNRCAALLAAAEDRENPDWSRLTGRMELGRGHYAEAVPHLLRVEKAWPEETARELEICYRELGDYKMAYEYACKQRG